MRAKLFLLSLYSIRLFSKLQYVYKIITGAPPQAGTGLKMQTIVFFSKLHCEGYIADLRYIAGSLLLGVLSAILESTRSTVRRKIFAF